MQTDMLSKEKLQSAIPYLQHFITTALEMKCQIYFVGGLARDLILNKKPTDIDIVPIGSEYTKVAKLLQRKIKCAAIPFKDNVRLVKDNIIIDVSAPRGKTIEEDLLMRDFTINNLAIDIDGTILGNLTDIQHQTIRAVYSQTFEDDPLRIFRAFRFVSQLGFAIETETQTLIRQHKHLLKTVAIERIFDELKKLINGTSFNHCFKQLIQFEILTELIPELNGLKQLGFSKYHSKDAFDHTVETVITMNNFAQGLNLSADDQLVLISTMILHDLGKADCKYANTKDYKGHENESEPVAKKVLDRLNYPKKPAANILNLIRYHSILRTYATEVPDDRVLKRFIYNHHDQLEYHFYVSLADNRHKESVIPQLRSLILKMKQLKHSMHFENTKQINGKDLITAGIKPGKEMKTILDDAHFKLTIGELEDKEMTLDYIKNTYM